MKTIGSDLKRLFGKEGATLFSEAVGFFNKGEFWESHEVFEDVWRMQKGDVKKLAQGFVQAAAAFSYVKLRRYESIIYLFDKSVEKLRAAVYLLPEVHVNRLVQAILTAKAEVQRLGESGLENFDPALYPQIEFSHRRSQRQTTVGTKRRRIQ